MTKANPQDELIERLIQRTREYENAISLGVCIPSSKQAFEEARDAADQHFQSQQAEIERLRDGLRSIATDIGADPAHQRAKIKARTLLGDS